MQGQDIEGCTSRRRRASKACIRCNTRKVRCDVSRVSAGTQCTNCRLDDQSCVIRPRARQRRPWFPEYRINQTPTIEENDTLNYSNVQWEISATNTGRDPDKRTGGNSSSVEKAGESRNNDFWSSRSFIETNRPKAFADAVKIISSPAIHYPRDTISPGLDGHLVFSYFSFLKLNQLSSMATDDATTLESSGCLHIPTKPALDHFVREYFLHVHPNLPMVDEGLFWKIYTNQERSYGRPTRLSLFLFQAMLFAASSSVPLRTLQRCGFRSVREARKTLYRRAKTLFDFEAEHDPYVVAQGALLLSYYSTNSERHLNTFWLSIAIQSAKTDGAHRYAENETLTKYEKQMKKRLWWCCVLRDRILPLGVRRPLQITLDHYDTRMGGLKDEDLLEDMGNSEVYDRETQTFLAKILIAQCKLAVEMTDLITILYPSESSLPITSALKENFNSALIASDRCKSKLIHWYDNVHSWVDELPKKTHPSVTLYTSLMFIYYHTARLALCHHQVLTLEVCSTSNGESEEDYKQQLDCFRAELRVSAAAVTQIVQDLLLLDLAQHLPISAMAYTALPLVLSALDTKLSPIPFKVDPKMGFDPLEAYNKTMKCFQEQFDGTEEVSATMDRILLEAEAHSRKLSARTNSTSVASSRNNNNNWYEIFLKYPKLHLRVAMAFDLTFSRGRFPEDKDFPKQLRADRFEDQMKQPVLSSNDPSLGVFEFHDDDELASMLLQVPRSPVDNSFSPAELVPTRKDLDFLDLFAEDDLSRNSSSAADVEFMDEFLDIADHGEREQDWEQTVMDLFEQSIPG